MAGFPSNEAAGPVFQTKTKKTASPTKWRPWLCSFSTSLARLPTSPPPPHSRTQIAALKTAIKEADELLLMKYHSKATTPPPTTTAPPPTTVPPKAASTRPPV